MPKYYVEVVNRWVVDTDNIDEVRENYKFSDVHTDSVKDDPDYIDGHFKCEIFEEDE